MSCRIHFSKNCDPLGTTRRALIRGIIVSLLQILSLSSVLAEEICAPIQGFIQRGESTDKLLPKATECGPVLMASGVEGWFCIREYPYRTGEAQVDFQKMLAELAQCLGSEPVQDQGVNHPDSYEMFRFVIANGAVELSIKEKSGLQKTFIALRVFAKP